MKNNLQDINIHQQHGEKLKSRNAVDAFDLVECCAVNEKFVTNVSGQPVCPTFKGQDFWSQQRFHVKSVSG
jgi:hypothetical protein